MYNAIKNNDRSKMEDLIKKGADINAPVATGHRYTPLEISITYDAWDCFQHLIGPLVNADINKDSGNGGPIGCAVVKAIEGVTRYFDTLYMRSDLQVMSGLLSASNKRTCCDITLFKKLLDHPNFPSLTSTPNPNPNPNANANAILVQSTNLSDIEKDRLSSNIENLGKPEFIEAVLKKKLDLDWTRVMYGLIDTKKGIDNIQLLLDNGYNVNKQYPGTIISGTPYRAYHPIMTAVEHGNLGVIKLLLKHKADINIENLAYASDGSTQLWVSPLYMAVCYRYLVMHNGLTYNAKTHLNIIKELLKAGAKADYVCKSNNKSVIHEAVEQGLDMEIIAVLMKSGAKIEKGIYRIHIPYNKAHTDVPNCVELTKLLVANGVEQRDISYYSDYYWKDK